MLADISSVDALYIITGFSSDYFYPHLFNEALNSILSAKKDEDNIF